MTLIRWEPFRETEEFMNRLMPSLLRGGLRAGTEGSNLPAVQWTPSADISETENEYLIRAEMPAVKKEDVKVTLHDGTIAIEGERKYEKEDKSEKFHSHRNLPGPFRAPLRAAGRCRRRGDQGRVEGRRADGAHSEGTCDQADAAADPGRLIIVRASSMSAVRTLDGMLHAACVTLAACRSPLAFRFAARSADVRSAFC